MVLHQFQNLFREGRVIFQCRLDGVFNLLDFEGIVPPIVLAAATDGIMDDHRQGLIVSQVVAERPFARRVHR